MILKSEINISLTKIKINTYKPNNYLSELLKENQSEHVKYINYQIINNGNTIILNGKSFDIPKWYNRQMILIRNSKTLEMVFYGIINNKIDELNCYKSKLK